MPKKINLVFIFRLLCGLLPYLVYTYYVKRINAFFAHRFGIDVGLQLNSTEALIKAADFLRMLVFNEGLIFFAVWVLYGKLKAFIYLKFSVVFIGVVMFFKAVTYFTHNGLIQKIAYSLGLLGTNIEWFLLILASFYFIKPKENTEIVA